MSVVRARVPEVAGSVRAVVPETAFGVIVAVPDVAPGSAIELIPVNARFALALFRATEVVPIYTVELPSTADGIVPERLPAVSEVSEAPEPENPVEVRSPVDGLYVNPVSVRGETFPVAELEKSG